MWFALEQPANDLKLFVVSRQGYSPKSFLSSAVSSDTNHEDIITAVIYFVCQSSTRYISDTIRFNFESYCIV